MSDDLYPIGLIKRLRVLKADRTVRDTFEDGSTSTRRSWSTGYFKRTFDLLHSPLTETEFSYLRDFWDDHGTYDSFWFRDNVNHDGNARVRFVDPFPMEYQGRARLVSLRMEETAASWTRSAVEYIAGELPIVWWDAGREIYYKHAGSILFPYTANVADRIVNYTAPWQAGTPAVNAGLADAYSFNGTLWAKTSINLAELTGTSPDMTLFLVAKASSTSTIQQFLTIGDTTGVAIGLTEHNSWYALRSDVTSHIGDPGVANDNDEWTSVAITGWSSPALYVNTVSGGTPGFMAHSYGAGPAVLGARSNGGKIANPGNAMANCLVAHAMVFDVKLTANQVKSLHNLFAPQFAMDTVL